MQMRAPQKIKLQILCELQHTYTTRVFCVVVGAEGMHAYMLSTPTRTQNCACMHVVFDQLGCNRCHRTGLCVVHWGLQTTTERGVASCAYQESYPQANVGVVQGCAAVATLIWVGNHTL